MPDAAPPARAAHIEYRDGKQHECCARSCGGRRPMGHDMVK
jgi:hypothetical protein